MGCGPNITYIHIMTKAAAIWFYRQRCPYSQPQMKPRVRAREQHCDAQELFSMIPCRVLRRGLPEGPPQAAQEGLQATLEAELKDERLYSQGHERPEGDFCLICTLPIPLPMYEHSAFAVCCMKRICYGCAMAVGRRGMLNCPFCRTPHSDSKNEADALAMVQKRVEKKDSEAIFSLGNKYYHGGEPGLQKDIQKAVVLREEAAELGSLEALCNLGVAYYHGKGVDKDKAKGYSYSTVKVAMQGHVESRYNLGVIETEHGNHYRAVRHILISAKVGHKASLDTIKRAFMGGHAMKEQYAKTLKGYQDAVEEMKSHDRDEAKRRFAKIFGRN
ncbi:hypothetical protein THAOC_16961 [Thalassiosira oceanica]|uniref:RING-type domain-containing protein n=1 Tax=Thalassiosira oceanica TaxID=159749 RepID=K0SBV4_THAOC|nr:hypothetical protein THAOC_16961 [Thalassiosira oceanica]|eukprot:EJK62429.1 hypothetical protein THAOC_16961 [Thalassiosira oceanica]